MATKDTIHGATRCLHGWQLNFLGLDSEKQAGWNLTPCPFCTTEKRPAHSECTPCQRFEAILTYMRIPFTREWKFAKSHAKTKTGRNNWWKIDYQITPTVGVEVEGAGLGHTTMSAYSLNCLKYNHAANLGITIYRYTTINLRDYTARVMEDLQHVARQ